VEEISKRERVRVNEMKMIDMYRTDDCVEGRIREFTCETMSIRIT